MEHFAVRIRDPDTKKIEGKNLESSEMWCWRRMEKIKWSVKATNEKVLERIGERRMFLNNIIRTKAN